MATVGGRTALIALATAADLGAAHSIRRGVVRCLTTSALKYRSVAQVADAAATGEAETSPARPAAAAAAAAPASAAVRHGAKPPRTRRASSVARGSSASAAASSASAVVAGSTAIPVPATGSVPSRRQLHEWGPAKSLQRLRDAGLFVELVDHYEFLQRGHAQRMMRFANNMAAPLLFAPPQFPLGADEYAAVLWALFECAAQGDQKRRLIHFATRVSQSHTELREWAHAQRQKNQPVPAEMDFPRTLLPEAYFATPTPPLSASGSGSADSAGPDENGDTSSSASQARSAGGISHIRRDELLRVVLRLVLTDWVKYGLWPALRDSDARAAVASWIRRMESDSKDQPSPGLNAPLDRFLPLTLYVSLVGGYLRGGGLARAEKWCARMIQQFSDRSSDPSVAPWLHSLALIAQLQRTGTHSHSLAHLRIEAWSRRAPSALGPVLSPFEDIRALLQEQVTRDAEVSSGGGGGGGAPSWIDWHALWMRVELTRAELQQEHLALLAAQAASSTGPADQAQREDAPYANLVAAVQSRQPQTAEARAERTELVAEALRLYTQLQEEYLSATVRVALERGWISTAFPARPSVAASAGGEAVPSQRTMVFRVELPALAAAPGPGSEAARSALSDFVRVASRCVQWLLQRPEHWAMQTRRQRMQRVPGQGTPPKERDVEIHFFAAPSPSPSQQAGADAPVQSPTIPAWALLESEEDAAAAAAVAEACCTAAATPPSSPEALSSALAAVIHAQLRLPLYAASASATTSPSANPSASKCIGVLRAGDVAAWTRAGFPSYHSGWSRHGQAQPWQGEGPVRDVQESNASIGATGGDSAAAAVAAESAPWSPFRPLAHRFSPTPLSASVFYMRASYRHVASVPGFGTAGGDGNDATGMDFAWDLECQAVEWRELLELMQKRSAGTSRTGV